MEKKHSNGKPRNHLTAACHPANHANPPLDSKYNIGGGGVMSGSGGATADLASLFECPVCFDYVLPPILQCQNGHLVCTTCRHKLTCCPSCRGPIGNIRNLAMEKVATTVFFPCKYSAAGCKQQLMHTEKTDHEELCEFRPYSCPCPGAQCKWFGSLDQVMPHLMHSHKSITTLQGINYHEI
ncbi:E3 ubiquitin-protein ligase SIAH1-like [Uloborus diversus]|uniref:E3 ubiquitin-protein ligase SIAH1-like n=1 Tax=Uloborus diversus TaxID=327109 RepID=UPI002409B5B0|nr:E3 ubiquitin-protein ligase SIAH1-like [Uloborus diversus]